MARPPNSVIWIKNNVINFFASKYRQPTDLFNWDSKVRAAFALVPLPRWKSLGRELNRQEWLISIHVIIDVDSTDWKNASTIGQITSYLNALFVQHRGYVAELKNVNIEKLLAADKKDKPPKKKKKKSGAGE